MTPTNPKPPTSRQTIRRILLVITFLLIPVTIFYVSPIVIIMGAAEGVATGSLLLYVALFVLSFFVARLWCGWLCPMGAWQELCSPVIKRTVKNTWLNRVKYVLSALWILGIGYLFISAGGIHAVDPLYGTVGGISISSAEVFGMVCLIFAIIFIVAFIAGKRGFCHVICPIAGIMVAGRKIRNHFGWPALGLQADAGKCTDCATCSRGCPMGLDVNGMVRKNAMENAECILCAKCADTCPAGAITYLVKKN